MASLAIDGVLNQLNYKNRGRVHADALNAVNGTKSLTPKVGTLTHNNGSVSRLLLLTGTFPIYYQSAQYNIPVDIYLPEQYPEVPPIIYLRPTSTMVIKHGHQHADQNGVVYLPYLHEWRTNSSLVELIPIMSSVFSIEPPMFSRPAGSTPSIPTQAYPTNQASFSSATAARAAPSTAQQHTNNTTTPSAVTSAAALYMRSVSGSEPTQHLPQSYNYNSTQSHYPSGTVTSARPSSHNSSPTSSASSANKAKLIQDVTVKMQEEIHKLQSRLRDEIDDEFRNQKELSQHQSDITETISNLQNTKDRLQNALSDLQVKRSELETWAKHKSDAGDVDPESRVQAYDDVSRQLISLQAEHNANEDAMYYLEK